MPTKTITIQVEECPVGGCEEAGEVLDPHFCRTHFDAFVSSSEGQEATRTRDRLQADFIARLNGTKSRCCMQCDRWGTSDDISMMGPEGGEEPFCDDRKACERRWDHNKAMQRYRALEAKKTEGR